MKYKRILMFLSFVLSMFLLIGCDMGTIGGKGELKKDPETFLDEAVVGEFDIREWCVMYREGSLDFDYVQVTYDMLPTSDIAKLSKIGTHELTFTYKECTFTHTITINEPSEEYNIAKIELAMKDDLIPSVTSSNIILPTLDGKIRIEWSSSSEYIKILGNKAIITRPMVGQADAQVSLHAVFTLYSTTLEKDYLVTIPAEGMDDVYQYLDDVSYAIKTPSSISQELDLYFEYEDVTITWVSSNNSVISIDNNNKKVIVNTVLEETSVTLSINLKYQNVVYENYTSYIIKVLPYSNIKKAPSVTNLKLSNNLLTWNAVSSISKYNIYVNGVLKETVLTNKILLTSIIKQAGQYVVGVQSVAEGIYNTDSDIVTINYTGVDSVGYNGTYYLSTNLKLSGNALKAALRTLISKTKHTTTYEELKTYNPIVDKSLTNSSKVVLIYSRIETKGAWSSGGLYWNREHVWPQSQGWFSTGGAGADLHHLRPEDPTLNSTRGNKPFGKVSGGTNAKVSSANGGIYSDCYYNGTFFEPKDEAKGDVARIVFYLFTRYAEADSYNVTRVAQSFKLLLEWNELDPVDEWEMNRNNEAEKIQGNRNPFIDYPNFAEEIWG